MRVKMLASLAGGINLAPGDEHEFEQAEAERLIEAGFATAVAPAAQASAKKPAKAKD